MTQRITPSQRITGLRRDLCRLEAAVDDLQDYHRDTRVKLAKLLDDLRAFIGTVDAPPRLTVVEGEGRGRSKRRARLEVLPAETGPERCRRLVQGGD